jgi:hypothetical protein
LTADNTGTEVIMDLNQPVPYMRLATDRVPAPKVKHGMNIDQVREIWRMRSEAKTKEIMDKYAKQKAGRSGGREGLGIYGQFQSRASREKRRLAERLLTSAGLPTDDATVRRLMRPA